MNLNRSTDPQIDRRLPEPLQKLATKLLEMGDPPENQRRQDDRRTTLVRMRPYILAQYEAGWSASALAQKMKTWGQPVGRNLLTDLIALWTGDAQLATLRRLFPALFQFGAPTRPRVQTALERVDAADQTDHCMAIIESASGRPAPGAPAATSKGSAKKHSRKKAPAGRSNRKRS